MSDNGCGENSKKTSSSRRRRNDTWLGEPTKGAGVKQSKKWGETEGERGRRGHQGNCREDISCSCPCRQLGDSGGE